jgi:hypothetical protein
MEWRTLGYLPNCQISETGLIRRLGYGQLARCRVRDGYRLCDLICADDKRRTFRVGRLVCEAWHGPPPSKKHQAAHWDGDSANDHWTNLRWAIPKENANDKFRHGTQQRGEAVNTARLTAELVRAIRSDRERGLTCERIAANYGIGKTNAWQIVARRVWKHI